MDFKDLMASFASGLIVSADLDRSCKLSVYRYIDGGDSTVLIVSTAVHVELGEKLSVSAEHFALGEPCMDAFAGDLLDLGGLFDHKILILCSGDDADPIG